jgi:putative addiction module killer protein
MHVILRYRDKDGRVVVSEWLNNLKDNRARARIAARLDRLKAGNFGDCKPLRKGVWELRINYGPGYRVYYAIVEEAVVLLLCCGDKRTQEGDIEKAVTFLADFRERVQS